ncbi:hypothetical protein BUALT_Bualt02G0009000 [Buddleja alternifolia]|uniref:Inhibitor I9 domain-containing protein n=1 Tax=Buddleja alternifolia TaxID=168488 RepID=A0AAV6Y0P7_9LAMI|nr:hypothetical protein BUALT_Bualt02G0009000 [Buddleja alternifolia]
MKLPNAVALALILFPWLLLASSESEKSTTYIIHMDKSSIPKAFSTHHYWYSSMLRSLAQAQTSPKIIYTYDNAFHGFSAVMSKHELEALKKFPGFISAYADDIVTPDTTPINSFLSILPLDFWPASNYGKDVSSASSTPVSGPKVQALRMME